MSRKTIWGSGYSEGRPQHYNITNETIWKIVKSKDNLWVNQAKKKHTKNHNILSHKVSLVASWQWKKLMTLRPLFKQGLRRQVINGKDIRFWDDNWILQYPLDKIIHPTLSLENIKVCDVIDCHGQ